jgi:hypothetical protein
LANAFGLENEIKIRKAYMKLSLFVGDMFVFQENSSESTDKENSVKKMEYKIHILKALSSILSTAKVNK